MTVIPAVRTAASGAIDYQAYLQTPEWRARRNRALREACYRCQRCGRGRSLEVHYRTYERFGHEWNEDLEVVCHDCHRGHHLDEAEGQRDRRLYLRLVTEALRGEPLCTVGDLSAAVKDLCARRRIPLDPRLLDRAINLVCDARLPPPTAPCRERRERPTDAPISAAEARELLARIGVAVNATVAPGRQMPPVSRWELPEGEVRA